MNVGTVGNESRWQACASTTGEDIPWSQVLVDPNPHLPPSPIMNAIGITNNLSNPQFSPEIPKGILGFNPYFWTGFWITKHWFIVPPDAIGLEFWLERVNVDDKAAVYVNGQLVGHFATGYATGAGTFQMGVCDPNAVLPPEPVEYRSGEYPVSPAPLGVPLYADRPNQITVLVNNTGGYELNLPATNTWTPDDEGVWDYTYVAMEARVHYYRIPPVPGTVQLTARSWLVQFEGPYGTSFTKWIFIKNTGTGTAQNVKLTLAKFGVDTGWKWTLGSDWHYVSTDFPIAIGNIPPGGTGTAIVTYAISAPRATPVIERYGGTYDGGTFLTSVRNYVP
ncbi:MAG TPA: hypothetical protein VN577_15640 [Terriglobales bacterium]|nr:hypothetical protein [Terriglobales bacterium]